MTRLEVATQLVAAQIVNSGTVDLDGAFEIADMLLARNEKHLREQYEAAPKCARCQYPESHHGLLKVYACRKFKPPEGP